MKRRKLTRKRSLTRKQKLQIIKEHYKLLISLALKILKNRTDAEDFVHQACIRFLKSKKAKGPGWLYSAVTLAYREKGRRRASISVNQIPDIEGKQPNPLDILLNEELKELLHKAIAMLNDKHRTPIVLYYLEEMSIKKVSELLEITPSAVRSRLFRGRKDLYGFLIRLTKDK